LQEQATAVVAIPRALLARLRLISLRSADAID
jgi:hypothetical protein